MNQEYEYKIITSDSDEKYLNDLLDNAALIHNREKDSLAWLKWKYFKSPFGESICIVALTEDLMVAGEVTFGQYQYVLNGEVIKCLISYQTMIHPSHQKKGLFKRLTKQVLEYAESKQIKLVLNFPNKASYIPFERLNFVPINHINNYVHFVVKPTTIIYLLSTKKPFFANKIDSIPSEQLALFEDLKSNIKPLNIKDTLTPNRTPEFIKWRYFTHPLFDYRIIKSKDCWCIVRLGKRGSFKEVQIMEVFANDNFTLEGMSQLRKAIVNQLKPNLVLINLSDNHPLNSIIKKSNFYSLPHNISFFTYAIDTNLNHLLNKNSWAVTATEFHRY